MPPLSPTPDAAPDVVPCPPSLRAEAQRALVLRLEAATAELGRCVASANEAQMPVNARRIENVRSQCAELPRMLTEDPR